VGICSLFRSFVSRLVSAFISLLASFLFVCVSSWGSLLARSFFFIFGPLFFSFVYAHGLDCLDGYFPLWSEGDLLGSHGSSKAFLIIYLYILDVPHYVSHRFNQTLS